MIYCNIISKIGIISKVLKYRKKACRQLENNYGNVEIKTVYIMHHNVHPTASQ